MSRLGIKPSTYRGIAILALIALATVLATRDVRQDLQTTRTSVDTRLNYALFDFEAKLLDEQGALAAIITAPVLRSNARSGVGTISEPEMFVRENGNDWNISANNAIVSADREFVSLTGKVNLVRYNSQASDRLDIDTRDLVVAIESRTVSTEAQVIMQNAFNRITATGMFLDLNTDQFELHNNVMAVYEPL